jgi:hypothetical protein
VSASVWNPKHFQKNAMLNHRRLMREARRERDKLRWLAWCIDADPEAIVRAMQAAKNQE